MAGVALYLFLIFFVLVRVLNAAKKKELRNGQNCFRKHSFGQQNEQTFLQRSHGFGRSPRT